MTPPDDIKSDTPPASTGEGHTVKPPQPAPKPRLREVHPESEVRGGPEAPEDKLD